MSTTTIVKTFFIGIIPIVAGGYWPAAGAGDVPTPAAASCDGRSLRPWVERAFGKPCRDGSLLPFSFTYGGVLSAKFLAAMGIHVPL